MVYTQVMRDYYRNKRRNEAPPHLYAIADGALQLMEMGKRETEREENSCLPCKFAFPLWILIALHRCKNYAVKEGSRGLFLAARLVAG